MRLGHCIKKERLSQGLQQQELAQKLGVHPTVISKWEAGSTLPSYKNLIGLHSFLGMSFKELYKLVEDETKERDKPVEVQQLTLFDNPAIDTERLKKEIREEVLLEIATLIKESLGVKK